MDTSVIGIYKSFSSAQSAMNELLKTGFSQESMEISGSSTGMESSGGVAHSLKEESGVGEFFRKLYGREDTQSHAQSYEHAAGQGNCVLTVHASSEEMGHRAADVMERFDPVDVEEYGAGMSDQSQSISASGTQISSSSSSTLGSSSVGSTGSAQGKDDVQKGRSQSTNTAASSGPSGTNASQSGSSSIRQTTASGSTSNETESMRDDVQKGRPLDMRKGVRMYQRSTGAPIQRPSTGSSMAGSRDESRFRSHWQSTYGSSGGSYDEYGPSYRYGSELRNGERWQGKQWSDMESDVRSDWEAKNPKGLWEKFKETVRYGWENSTGTYEDEARGLGNRMAPGMGVEHGLGDDRSTAGTGSSKSERSRPSTSASPGTGTSAASPAGRPAMSGGMSTSGASFTSDERGSTMSTPKGTTSGTGTQSSSPMSSSGMQDDLQEGRSQDLDAAMSAGPSATGSESSRSSSRTSKTSETSVKGGGAHIPDDVEYRSHWQHSHWTSGGSYDDYAPAYRYGADYADNDTNPNHQWKDVENRMKSDWETYNRDPGSWDKNVEAIRYGWEKGKQRARGTHSGQALR